MKPADKIRVFGQLKHSKFSPMNGKIGLAHGCFDGVHAGHLLYLQEARRRCDLLVVTITSDQFVKKQKGLNKPVFTAEKRALMLAELQCVDFIVINDSDTAVNAIDILRPAYYFKGVEYQGHAGAIMQEQQAVEKHGGEVIYIDTAVMSSSKLANENYSDMLHTPIAKAFLDKLRLRYGGLSSILAMLDDLSTLRVLIVGEAIIDIYTYVEVLDKAPKTNILAWRHNPAEHQQLVMAGGAVNVANTVAQFCQHADLLTYIGTPPDVLDTGVLAFLQDKLVNNVSIHDIPVDRPAVTKQRFIETTFTEQQHRETLGEVVFLDDRPLPLGTENRLRKWLKERAAGYDLVIAIDFGHALISKKVASDLALVSKFLAVCVQTNESNVGFNTIRKYGRADYLCLDDIELHLASQNKYGGLPVLLSKAARDKQVSCMALTLGGRGCMLHSPGGEYVSVPVFSGLNPIDRIGAGDAFLSITAPCAAMKYPMSVIGFLGNVVGALACEKIGTSEVVGKTETRGFIKSLLA